MVEAFKIEHFERDNPDIKFPWHISLTKDQADKICLQVKNLLGLPSTANGLAVLKGLAEREKSHKNLNAQDLNFSLENALCDLSIKAESTVYINWHRFDNIDLMKLIDLSQHLKDIWYPSSDDIEIFDSRLSWFLSISHDGVVSTLQLAH